ncbi:MAG: DoxX family protein [Planctomycetota bacterium]
MLKTLYAPFRLATGWGLSPRILGLMGISMLVLLRLTIGWHFFTEGLVKVQGGDWSAKPFFANSTGPFAHRFRAMIWDSEGTIRFDRDALLTQWVLFRERAARDFEFTDAQKNEAQACYARAAKLYDILIADSAADIEEFRLGEERLKKLDNDPRRSGVDTLAKQRDTIRRERDDLVAPIFGQIDAITNDYVDAVNDVATEDQVAKHRRNEIRMPPTSPMDTSVVDPWLPYFDLTLGLLLLAGLFTPLAGLVAAVFLGSVFLSQYPPSTGPTSSMYPLIEGIACLVLAGTGAGRFAGLDFFFHMITRKSGSPGTPTRS